MTNELEKRIPTQDLREVDRAAQERSSAIKTLAKRVGIAGLLGLGASQIDTPDAYSAGPQAPESKYTQTVDRSVHPATTAMAQAGVEVAEPDQTQLYSQLQSRNLTLEAAPQHSNTDFILRDTEGNDVGFFTTRTNGQDGQGDKGFLVIDDEDAPMWTLLQQYGGVDVLGYPISHRFTKDGKLSQGFQRAVLETTKTSTGETIVSFGNVLDEVRKEVNLNNPTDLIPDSLDWSSDEGKQFGLQYDDKGRRVPVEGSIEANHFNLVFRGPQCENMDRRRLDLLEQSWLSDPAWVEKFGLPVGIEDYGAVIVVLGQRGALQLWVDDTPWTDGPDGRVPVNGGDVAKKYGVFFPPESIQPQENPLGTGGGIPEILRTADLLLAQTERVDYLEGKDRFGQTISIETKITPSARASADFNPDTEQELMQDLSRDTELNNFDDLKILILSSDSELPTDIANAYPGNIGKITNVKDGKSITIGRILSGRDSTGEIVIVYFIPAETLNLQDEEHRFVASRALTGQTLRASFSGGDLTNPWLNPPKSDLPNNLAIRLNPK